MAIDVKHATISNQNTKKMSNCTNIACIIRMVGPKNYV